MLLMEDVPTKRRNVRWFRAATRWHEENTLHIPNAVVRSRMSDALKNSAQQTEHDSMVHKRPLLYGKLQTELLRFFRERFERIHYHPELLN